MKEPKYKLVCIDLDGTLLSYDKKVSIENINAIQEAIKNGVRICIATGRIYKFVDHIKEMIGNDIEVIASNGALILKDSNEFILNPLSYDEVLKINDLIKDYDVEIYLNTEEDIISEGSIPNDYTYKVTNKVFQNKHKVNIIENYSFSRLSEDNKYNILKIVIMNKNNLDEVNRVRKILEYTKEYEIASSEPQYCEINKKGISKGIAVEKLARIYDICIDDVICIGDGGNDVEMLKRAGVAVVMENGMDNVKALADYITDDNNNSGVARAINRLILDD